MRSRSTTSSPFRRAEARRRASLVDPRDEADQGAEPAGRGLRGGAVGLRHDFRRGAHGAGHAAESSRRPPRHRRDAARYLAMPVPRRSRPTAASSSSRWQAPNTLVEDAHASDLRGRAHRRPQQHFKIKIPRRHTCRRRRSPPKLERLTSTATRGEVARGRRPSSRR